MNSGMDYENLIGEIVRKQMDILGPDMAVRTANQVTGLEIDDQGVVSKLDGDPEQILQKLVEQYISLSGEIVRNILNPVFQKYPEIKLNLNK